MARGRPNGPLNIAYEIHGTGPRKILFIMGLGGLRSSWQRQSKDFGHTHGDKYSVLVFDNRGIGQSDKPYGRYSTSEMAKDTVDLLDQVGWTEARSVNIVGVSMGGMIAQEMGLLIPNRIASVMFLSTAAELINTVGFFENLRSRINMFIPRSIDAQIENAKHMIYTQEYLDSPDTLETTSGKPFPTSGDRFAAHELQKRSNPDAFTRAGFIQQAIAAGWHRKSKEQLRDLAEKVGRERIMVVHGTRDRMITLPHAEALASGLSGDGVEVKKVIWEGQGHVIPIEKREEFHQLLAEQVERFYKV